MTNSIIYSAEAWKSYKQTVGRLPPETFGILGGSLDDPYRVIAFKFLPPRAIGNDVDASSVHINIDPGFINYIVDNEWRPNGLELLGIAHSHPGTSFRLSQGDGTTGDVAYFAACLDNDDSEGRRWHTCLAPITTFNPDGTDTVHGWILERGSRVPRSISVIVEKEQTRELSSVPLFPEAEAVLGRCNAHVGFASQLLARHAAEITTVRQNSSLSEPERDALIRRLDALMQSESRQFLQRRHPISVALGLADEHVEEAANAMRQIDRSLEAVRNSSGGRVQSSGTTRNYVIAHPEGLPMRNRDNSLFPFFSPPAP